MLPYYHEQCVTLMFTSEGECNRVAFANVFKTHGTIIYQLISSPWFMRMSFCNNSSCAVILTLKYLALVKQTLNSLMRDKGEIIGLLFCNLYVFLRSFQLQICVMVNIYFYRNFLHPFTYMFGPKCWIFLCGSKYK